MWERRAGQFGFERPATLARPSTLQRSRKVLTRRCPILVQCVKLELMPRPGDQLAGEACIKFPVLSTCR